VAKRVTLLLVHYNVQRYLTL